MRRSIIALAAVLLTATAPMALACGPSDVCSDVDDNFAGTVIEGDKVKLDWNTDEENGNVLNYKIFKYETDPQNAEFVTDVTAVGECSTTEYYSYTDTDGDPTWHYSLEVWESGNTRTCAIDIVPE